MIIDKRLFFSETRTSVIEFTVLGNPDSWETNDQTYDYRVTYDYVPYPWPEWARGMTFDGKSLSEDI